MTSLGRSCVYTVSSIGSKIDGLAARLISSFPVVYCNMVTIYTGDLPNDWCLVPLEKIVGLKGTYFQVGCLILHFLSSSIFSPREWPSCDLINTEATLVSGPKTGM